MNQSVPAAPAPHPRAAPGHKHFFCLAWQITGGWRLLSCPIPWGGKKKKRANAPASINTATFFIDLTVEWYHFKHFNVRFVLINVCLCNSAMLIKTSRYDDTNLLFYGIGIKFLTIELIACCKVICSE